MQGIQGIKPNLSRPVDAQFGRLAVSRRLKDRPSGTIDTLQVKVWESSPVTNQEVSFTERGDIFIYAWGGGSTPGSASTAGVNGAGAAFKKVRVQPGEKIIYSVGARGEWPSAPTGGTTVVTLPDGSQVGGSGNGSGFGGDLNRSGGNGSNSYPGGNGQFGGAGGGNAGGFGAGGGAGGFNDVPAFPGIPGSGGSTGGGNGSNYGGGSGGRTSSGSLGLLIVLFTPLGKGSKEPKLALGQGFGTLNEGTTPKPPQLLQTPVYAPNLSTGQLNGSVIADRDAAAFVYAWGGGGSSYTSSGGGGAASYKKIQIKVGDTISYSVGGIGYRYGSGNGGDTTVTLPDGTIMIAGGGFGFEQGSGGGQASGGDLNRSGGAAGQAGQFGGAAGGGAGGGGAGGFTDIQGFPAASGAPVGLAGTTGVAPGGGAGAVADPQYTGGSGGGGQVIIVFVS